jgi:hypothetical protein
LGLTSIQYFERVKRAGSLARKYGFVAIKTIDREIWKKASRKSSAKARSDWEVPDRNWITSRGSGSIRQRSRQSRKY